MKTEKEKRAEQIREFIRDEREAAWLYRYLAKIEKDEQRAALFREMAEIEDRHATFWEEELKRLGDSPPASYSPSLKLRLYSLLAKLMGPVKTAKMLEENEYSTVLDYKRALSFVSDESKRELEKIIKDEEEHQKTAMRIRFGEKGEEPWHTRGLSIRDVIFGMNDGLLSIFSLVTGMSGATANDTHTVVLAGIAGTLAGAISMAAGAYVSVQSEREAQERQIFLEREELEAMPEEEEKELVVMFQLKGFTEEEAKGIASRMMEDKERTLEHMVREELGIDPGGLPEPWKAGVASGVSFVVGAAVPMLPFVLFPPSWAMAMCILMSLGGFFVIGAGRTVVTGKNPIRSGLQMFSIGTGAAIVTYLLGRVFGVAV